MRSHGPWVACRRKRCAPTPAMSGPSPNGPVAAVSRDRLRWTACFFVAIWPIWPRGATPGPRWRGRRPPCAATSRGPSSEVLPPSIRLVVSRRPAAAPVCPGFSTGPRSKSCSTAPGRAGAAARGPPAAGADRDRSAASRRSRGGHQDARRRRSRAPVRMWSPGGRTVRARRRRHRPPRAGWSPSGARGAVSGGSRCTNAAPRRSTRWLGAGRAHFAGPESPSEAVFLNRAGRRLGPRDVRRLLDHRSPVPTHPHALQAQLRHPPSRWGRRPAGGPGTPRARQSPDDPGLHSCQQGASAIGLRSNASPCVGRVGDRRRRLDGSIVGRVQAEWRPSHPRSADRPVLPAGQVCGRPCRRRTAPARRRR